MKRALIGTGIALALVGVLAYAATTMHGPVVIETRPLLAHEIESGRDDSQKSLDRHAIKSEQIASTAFIAVGAVLTVIGISVRTKHRTP